MRPFCLVVLYCIICIFLRTEDASSSMVSRGAYLALQLINFFRLSFVVGRKEAVSPGLLKFHILKRLSCEARTVSLSTGFLSGDLYWRQGAASWGRRDDQRNTQNCEKLCSVARIAWEISTWKLEAWNGRMALQNFHITQSWGKIHELADICMAFTPADLRADWPA